VQRVAYAIWNYRNSLQYTYLTGYSFQVFRSYGLANEYQSSKLCEARFSECEDKMDHLQALKLPSMAKFNAGFLRCNQSFVMECVGPAKGSYEQRMSKVYFFDHKISSMIIH
jgi:hypothetical protein